jgi:hypothetical protein
VSPAEAAALIVARTTIVAEAFCASAWSTSAPFEKMLMSPAVIVLLLSMSMTAAVIVPGPETFKLWPLARKRT